MGEEERERERDCNETEITAVSHQRLVLRVKTIHLDGTTRECDAFGYVYNADVMLISQCVTCSPLQKLEKRV